MTRTSDSGRSIRRLDPATIAQIAAGEVVERPASVAKELIENALDAGAHEVVVRVEDSGLRLLEVLDDGVGIPSDELDVAVERHTTSKIRHANDLGNVRTLGFRGEALASIASVARLTVASRPPGEELAHALEVDGAHPARRSVEARATGTTVRVSGLFAATPARRKFLRSRSAETHEILATVERAYLARPEVGFTLAIDDRPALRYPATSSLRDAAASVLGDDLLGACVPLVAPLGVAARVEGVVSLPGFSRGNSLGIFFSVNGRPIESRSFVAAFRAAYHDYLPRARFPVGVIHLAIDLRRVDVNVHPGKREVRVAGERELADELRGAVRRALSESAEAHVAPASHGSASPSPALDLSLAAQVAARLSDRPIPGPGLASAVGSAAARSIQRRLPIPESRRGSVRRPQGGRLELVGELHHLYWLASADEGLVLIDQHAASERLVYDALLRNGRLAHQRLVEPVHVTLNGRERAAFAEHHATVEASGFSIESFGPNAFRVLSVPVYRGYAPRPEIVRELLSELAEGGRPTIPNGLVERRAASIACHAAVRAGDPVPMEAMQRILEGLADLPEASYACPHGRPIRVLLPRARLDRWFLRSPT
ncbi:MAG: DNA mismatch repair endonuclease MutL [Thermoplasmata archaeon]